MSASFSQKVAVDSDEDPVTLMLQKTGCIELHYKVQVSSRNFAFLSISQV
jgi:hypothetical protein